MRRLPALRKLPTLTVVSVGMQHIGTRFAALSDVGLTIPCRELRIGERLSGQHHEPAHDPSYEPIPVLVDHPKIWCFDIRIVLSRRWVATDLGDDRIPRR